MEDCYQSGLHQRPLRFLSWSLLLPKPCFELQDFRWHETWASVLALRQGYCSWTVQRTHLKTDWASFKRTRWKETARLSDEAFGQWSGAPYGSGFGGCSPWISSGPRSTSWHLSRCRSPRRCIPCLFRCRRCCVWMEGRSQWGPATRSRCRWLHLSLGRCTLLLESTPAWSEGTPSPGTGLLCSSKIRFFDELTWILTRWSAIWVCKADPQPVAWVLGASCPCLVLQFGTWCLRISLSVSCTLSTACSGL